MTVEMIAELFRNLHAAADGGLHGASAFSLGEVVWAEYVRGALRAGQQAYNSGGDPDQAFRDSMAESLGMSRTEFDMFWNSDYSWDMKGADSWTRDVSDPLDEYFRRYGRR